MYDSERKREEGGAMAKRRKKHFFARIIGLLMLLTILTAVAVAAVFYLRFGDDVRAMYQEARRFVEFSDESAFQLSQTSVVYASDGTIISRLKGTHDTSYVEYEDIPLGVCSAIVSIEDKRFYRHDGVDYIALLRAAKAMLETGEVSQGGSTITMQLARNTFLNQNRNWRRKVEEIFIALELEKVYEKEDILEFYINNIYFGNGYYGIQAASRGYFDKTVERLNLSEMAFLCAIPNSPSYYDPITNFDNTIARRDRILKNMYEDGRINESAYLNAIYEEIELELETHTDQSQRNNYVDTYVYYCATRALMKLEGFEFKEYFDSEAEQKEYYQNYDEFYADCQKQIFAEGYKIYTSIEMDKQEALQNSVNEVLSGYTEVNEDGVYKLQGSAVCIDNDTGMVVAIVGGREQNIGIYTLNRAYQSFRQPGSSIKPLIVYTPFFEQGNTPDTMVMDEKIEGGPASSYYRGEITTRYAVELSLNSVAWSLYEQITPAKGLQYLKDMDFSKISSNDYVSATALGGFTKGASALEMAAGFATLENDGIYRAPTCIQKILDADNNIVYINEPEGKKIYGETAARMMTNVLETAMIDGTGKSARLEEMPCAGKTGTTNDNKDGWFVGYTRYYTTSVWVGCDLPQEIRELQGASYPAEIWKSFMTYANQGLVPMNFLPYAQLSDEFLEEHYPVDTETEDELPDDEAGTPTDEGEGEQPSDEMEGEQPSDEG